MTTPTQRPASNSNARKRAADADPSVIAWGDALGTVAAADASMALARVADVAADLERMRDELGSARADSATIDGWCSALEIAADAIRAALGEDTAA
jgi:hypothetical protein